jgi:hypothetical protein
MYKLIRVMVAISLVLGIVFLARDQVAWAEPAAEVDPSGQGEEIAASPMNFDDDDGDHHGSVKPPRRRLWVCKEGVFSVGGVATLSVENLAPGYCLRAFLWRHRWPPVHLPSGAGRILADITFLQVYYHNRFKAHLPVEDGTVEICYAVPPGKEAKIYFLDFYGRHRGGPTWVALETTMKDGLACAPAQNSGAYALIGS